MIVGFAREPLRPPLPFDPQGQAGRVRPVTDLDDALSITACVLRVGPRSAPIVIIGADVLAHTPAFSSAARRAIASALRTSPERVLLNASHTHASLWPGATRKVSGPDLDAWHQGERAYLASLKRRYVEVARRALAAAVPARAAWASGTVPGLIGNRREPDGDGGTIIGWDRDRPVEDTVSVVRFDA